MITGNHLQSNVRCIYFLSFPNDKKYIGQTNHSIHRGYVCELMGVSND